MDRMAGASIPHFECCPKKSTACHPAARTDAYLCLHDISSAGLPFPALSSFRKVDSQPGDFKAFPRLQVINDILFVKEDRLYTSAGISSGISGVLPAERQP
jgi:hypothetical protein